VATKPVIEYWPRLPLDEWHDTYSTLHMWTQIVGKVRLGLAPHINHWWQVTFYVTPRGLTTSAIPYGQLTFEVQFDFHDHRLIVSSGNGAVKSMPLSPMPVADFHGQFMDLLHSLGLDVHIWPVPVEVADPIPFKQDRTHASYHPEYANRLWRILAQSARVMDMFRSRFIGKCSPVHFFWGAFDMAVTRFSGRRAPEHQPMPNLGHFVAIEAYTHEVSSCGFWPGGGPITEPVYYAYAYPEPEGFRDYRVRPDAAYYHKDFGEFFLPYEAVRTAGDPDGELLAFCQSTYEAAAETARWDRASLEYAKGAASSRLRLG
jgi:hypothetical protein